MPSLKETDDLYMGTALLYSKLSKGRRAKVGASLVLPSGVTFGGTNGLPSALGNDLETEQPDGLLVTKPSVIHAELNCILKAALEGVSVKGGRMYLTLSPCEQCASMMVAAGIQEVVYLQEYRNLSGVRLLEDAKVYVRQLKDTKDLQL